MSIPDAKRVYKRSHSANSEHVDLPGQKKQKKRPEPALEPNNPLIYWFAQEINPLLRQVGEIRIVLVNSHQIFTMQLVEPNDGDWANMTLTDVATLDEIAAR